MATIKQLPKTGDIYFCELCGLEITVESDCQCDHGELRLECCSQPMTKA